FMIAPYIGDGSLEEQYMWLDDLTLATGRISRTPNPAIASVTVGPSSANVALGGTYQFAATLKDSSGNVLSGPAVTWASSSPAVFFFKQKTAYEIRIGRTGRSVVSLQPVSQSSPDMRRA